MNKYKLNMTRPDFLLRLINEKDQELLSTAELDRLLPEYKDLIYCAYSVLLNSNISDNAIRYAHCDEDTIVIQFSSKSIAKKIKSEVHDMDIPIGNQRYHVNVSSKGLNLYISINKIESLEEGGGE